MFECRNAVPFAVFFASLFNPAHGKNCFTAGLSGIHASAKIFIDVEL
jgi:hypothetical protein